MKTSLNHSYRLVWSDVQQTFVPVPECASGRGKSSGGKARRITRSLLASLALTASVAHAQAVLPAGGQIVGGSASIATQGKSMTVTQTSDRMAADWQSFSIGKDHSVNFVQPSSNSVALNRVLGSDVSVIQGAINANGQVFLVNPNGVLFTKDAQVNVGAMVASTLNISTADFMAGNYKFEGASSNAIVNQGRMTAVGNGAGGGTVALIAAKITNEGSIQAHAGNVLMGAGSKVTLDLGGPVKIQVEQGVLEALIEQGGAIKADGGLVYLSAKAAGDLASSVINHTGIAEAKSLSINDRGQVVLDSDHAVIHTGTVDVSGVVGGRVNVRTHNLVDAGKTLANSLDVGGEIRIDASGRVLQTRAASLQSNSVNGTAGRIRIEAGESAWLSGNASATGRQGGDISMTAPDLTLAETRLDARGTAVGGRIRVGGGWQGQDVDLTNALRTRLVAAELDVSATQHGNGGTAVIWSENETLFGGLIAARGGVQSGNGGQVEVSSRDQLGFGGLVDAHAPRGRNGRLLLDPKNLEIVASVAAINVLSLPDPSPSANESFGGTNANVAELKNNGTAIDRIVVASQMDDVAATNSGAVYVYNSKTGALISILTGSKAEDRVGQGGVTALTNGNFVVRSQSWDNGFLVDVGAVTWGNGITGISGVVSASNSLIGSTAADIVGNNAITVLNNGNYVVRSNLWDNGGVQNVGAVTWGNGSTGTVGVVSASNSLIGSTANDQIGSAGVVALSNGNYVVASPNWDNGATPNAGAATWGNGTTGVTGVVSASNSLVGTKHSDSVGGLVVALTNGNYVVASPSWGVNIGSQEGAVTWGNGSTGIIGAVTTSNSLHGSTTNDRVGIGHPVATSGVGVFALTNGNYVVSSSLWNNGGLAFAGAVTWSDGSTGITGAVSTSNSLVGSKASDLVGANGVTALSNGNYVVRSANWSDGVATLVGAATWGNGTTGTTGVVSAANSLVGSTTNDQVSLNGVTALTNGNYVVNTSTTWDNGSASNAGAITWGNGSTGTSGVVSAANSLVGSTAMDNVGSAGIVALTNGNYVVTSPFWDNGAKINVGAVTWGNGTTGISGAVSDSNSLVGGSANDQIGRTQYSGGAYLPPVIALTNGNYVVSSPNWNGGSGVLGNGAVTWGNGASGITGAISASNSMLGEVSTHSIGSSGIFALSNGDYLVKSQLWDNGPVTNVGAVTWVNGSAAVTGTVTAGNSILGSTANDNFGNGANVLLADGRVLLGSSQWNNNGLASAGRLDILSLGSSPASLPLSYSTNPGANSKLLASTLLASLNSGTAVTLQANNDIMLSTSLTVNNASGNGGHLTLQAGRSILLNADITTDDGNLTLIANDIAANGVVNAYRDDGPAVITQAAGTSINAGTGAVRIDLRDGAGNTNNSAGTVTLASIIAADLSVQSQGFSATASAQNKTQDGSPTATLSNASVSGLDFQAGSNLSLITPTSGTFASASAGSGVVVTSDAFKITGYSGADSSNLLKGSSSLKALTQANIEAAPASGGSPGDSSSSGGTSGSSTSGTSSGGGSTGGSSAVVSSGESSSISPITVPPVTVIISTGGSSSSSSSSGDSSGGSSSNAGSGGGDEVVTDNSTAPPTPPTNTAEEQQRQAAIQAAQMAAQAAARQASAASAGSSGIAGNPAGSSSTSSQLGAGSSGSLASPSLSGGLAFVNVSQSQGSPESSMESSVQAPVRAVQVSQDGAGRDVSGFMRVFVVNGGISLPPQIHDADHR